jgi:mannose-1-phosphate guanylyltransferase/phosphomannomutase
MVLAAGVGERMRPLTDLLPKPLLPIANRPVMSYILTHLAGHGFDEVVANVHYRADDVVAALGDGASCGVRLSYAYEDRLWGSAGSVKRSADFLGEGTFLVTGADDLTAMDLSALLARHRQAGAQASIGLVEVEETSQYGIVVTDEAGRIQRFVEKPQGRAPSSTANTQIYLFEPEICDLIPAGDRYDFGFHVFPALVAEGRPFYGFALPGYWRDIGSLGDYFAAQRDVMQRAVGAEPPGTQVAPGIWMGEDCRIHPEAKLEPPVVIGDRCRIGPGAVIRGATSIASGVEVPGGVLLDNCVLWEGAQVPAGAELRQAVICRRGVL